MILSTLMRLRLHPKLCCLHSQLRNIRPNIIIGKEKFQLQLDVRNYDRDEIRVKARPEYVVIEGKQQKQTKRGLVTRQFVRKFKLPSGCVMECMESKLSPDGVLTITAPRKSCDSKLPIETLIPIKPGFPQKDQEAPFVPVQVNVSKPAEVKPDSCAQFNRNQEPPPPSDKKN